MGKILDVETLNSFIRKANHSHQQFCIWLYINNEFSKYQKDWNQVAVPDALLFKEEHSRDTDCKYINFFDVVIPSLQHSWILSLARLFDPAYHSHDKRKDNPRLSLEYILELLDDSSLAQSIRNKLKKYDATVKSLKDQRNNFLAHNDVNFKNTKIDASIEDLFKELESIVSDIKNRELDFKKCNNINLEYTEVLSHRGVEEVFDQLLKK